MTRRFTAALFAVMVAAAPAHASGFYFGDNGATARLQGGAFTAQADDLSAMQYNPAGLAQRRGFSFTVDLQLMQHAVSFWRQDPGYDPANPSRVASEVSNQGGLFIVPLAGVSYGIPIGTRTLAIGLGVYTPPGLGRYAFPTPNYAMTGNVYDQNPIKFAPQRYTLISNDVLIAYPTLSVAIDLHPRVLIGASLQMVVSHITLSQAVYSGLSTPQFLADESPLFDSLVNVDLNGRPRITANFGALVKPTDWLAIGVSFRPPVHLIADGTLKIDFPETSAAKKLGAVIDGDRAKFDMVLPAELRFGVRVKPMKNLGINADFVYIGWNSIDYMRLSPQGVTMAVGGDAPKAIAEFKIPRMWQASFSARLGATYDFGKWVSAHAGFAYETSAIPDEYFTIDYAHPSRAWISAGATGHLGPIDIIAGISFTPTQVKDVVQSSVLQGQTSEIPGGVVGAGIYSSGGYSIILGVRGSFGGGSSSAAAAEPVKPQPPPPANDSVVEPTKTEM